MKNNPLFRYSLNFKVFIFIAAFLAIILFTLAIFIRFDITELSLYIWITSLIVFCFSLLAFFLYYVSIPLHNISEQILLLLTGKQYKNIPPLRNDEIGVITHFFNTVTEKIKGLSEDISEGKRMSSELELAAQIQAEVLPKQAPENIIGLEIVAKTRSSSEIGGDCFDFLEQNDDTIIYIGDVTGHGVPAGLVMMLVSTTIRALIKENTPPKSVIAKTNTLIAEKISTNHFMSLVMLRWNNIKQKMSYIGAGHEYILHYSMKDKNVHAIKSGGIALKMISNISTILQEIDLDFQEGDALLLYTDGITEAKNKQGEMYKVSRLQSVFLQNAYRKATDIFDKITDDFASFLGPNHHQMDDITMIVIKNIGEHKTSQKVQLSIHADEKNKMLPSTKSWDWE